MSSAKTIGYSTGGGFVHEPCFWEAGKSADSRWRGVRMSHELHRWPRGKECAICGGKTGKPRVKKRVSASNPAPREASRAPSAAAIYALVSPHAKHDGRTFTKADAESLRDAMSAAAMRGGRSVDDVLERANREIDAHGVESIPRDDGRWVDGYFGNTKLLYVNMGDPYITTVVYNVARRAFGIRPWASR